MAGYCGTSKMPVRTLLNILSSKCAAIDLEFLRFTSATHNVTRIEHGFHALFPPPVLHHRQLVKHRLRSSNLINPIRHKIPKPLKLNLLVRLCRRQRGFNVGGDHAEVGGGRFFSHGLARCHGGSGRQCLRLEHLPEHFRLLLRNCDQSLRCTAGLSAALFPVLQGAHGNA